MTAKNTSAAKVADVKDDEKKVPAQSTKDNTTEVGEDTNGKLSLILGEKVPGTARLKSFFKDNKKTIIFISSALLTGVAAALVKSRMGAEELVEDVEEIDETSAA